ncbi:Homoserine/homoserine lactone efflux protein [Pseudovibrio axinellae]|uniref:Homoserine/homoserine lactone efflux protein n=1 Tax=Pseudovibrio axinellae TaxID=989403 RepID=A0A165U243_9HYPH|nr:LysE family translocator [Pseudovibrio axinellae]KZL09470.1 Homoserine/homoserine lactone efflux protein [Pseudovibrio axinellae]SEQ63855.1 Threonine/homoserine/homoserine lactone efflux protein [Pseudovibrio axinellae]
MIPLDVLAGFFAITVLLALAPGPDNIFVLTQSAMCGRMAGFVVTLGLCSGLVFHTAAVALGVAAIFQASETAFTLVKVLGVGYLLYLACGAFTAKPKRLQQNKVDHSTLMPLYRRGVIMNITNPKVAIFFLSFFPHFVDPAYGPVLPQFLQLGVVFIFSTIMVFSAVAIAAGAIGERLSKSEGAQKAMNRIASVIFIGMALKLAAATR